MNKKRVFVIVALVVALVLLGGCTTMTRWMVGYSMTPYIGMPEETFRANCPLLYHVNETRTATVISRQYCMDGNYHPKYVYFENGILVATQY